MSHSTSLDFSLFQIKLFLAVAEASSFSRAAETMHVEQSTLSRRIAVLEQELGFPLFNRESRPIQLTRKGAALYEQWKPLVGAFEHSLSLVCAQREEATDTLSICMVDSGNHVSDVPAISMLMREAYPDVTLMFHYSPMDHWTPVLLDGIADITLTVGFDVEGLDDRFVVNEIMVVPKLVCMLRSNPLSRKERITFEDLREQQFISIADSGTPKHAAFIRRICNAHGFEPRLGGRSANAHGLTSMLQADNQVLVCDQFLRGLDSPMFKIFELPDTYSGLYTAYLKDSKNPYTLSFIKLLRSYYNQ